jgi:hypothetical protein
MEDQAPTRSAIWRAFEGGGGHEGAEPGDGVVGDDAALVEDDDAVADTFDGFQFVGAEEDDFAAGGEFLDEAAEDKAGADIEAGEGFVEQEKIGVMEEGGGEEDLLAHAFGVGGDGGVAVGVEGE